MGVQAEDAGWTRLGGAIRERRLHRSLSLVSLASLAELSQPFLSQIENGRARPSLLSLRRIAEALHTTPQSLFEGPSCGPGAHPMVVRAGDVQSVGIAGSDGDGTCRLLLAGESPVHLLEFDGLPATFLDYFEHDGFEAIHVVAGAVEVDLAGTVTALGPGDSMAYDSRSPHRFRSAGTASVRALLFETARTRRGGDHVVTRTPRARRSSGRAESSRRSAPGRSTP